METRYDFELQVPLKYARDGNEAEARGIVIVAPSRKHLANTAKLRQMIGAALRENSERAPGEDVPESKMEISGSQLMAMLSMSSAVDLERLETVGRDLLLSPGLCLLDGVQQLTAPLYDSMSDVDGYNLLGEYLARFLLSLWTQALAKT